VQAVFQTAQQNSFDQNRRLAAEALTVDSLARLTRRDDTAGHGNAEHASTGFRFLRSIAASCG